MTQTKLKCDFAALLQSMLTCANLVSIDAKSQAALAHAVAEMQDAKCPDRHICLFLSGYIAIALGG
jgi:hypothetical protein